MIRKFYMLVGLSLFSFSEQTAENSFGFVLSFRSGHEKLTTYYYILPHGVLGFP